MHFLNELLRSVRSARLNYEWQYILILKVGKKAHCKKSKNNMPHENASWKRAGHK
jgi:hypothetical protein